MNASDINTRFDNAGNKHNPVFEDIISDLIDAGLYTSALEFKTTGPTTEDKEIDKIKKDTVFNFKNPDGEVGSVSIDVLVHAISVNVLKGLRDGFTQIGIPKDGASNISYIANPNETTAVSNIALEGIKDVNQAIYVLAQEISLLKKAANIQVPSGLPIYPNIRKLNLG